jgi:hypothetical protein
LLSASPFCFFEERKLPIPATINTDAQGRVAQLDRASAF